MDTLKNNEESPSWYSVSTLEIRLADRSDRASIFSNGMHQVIIDVYIQPIDKNRNNISVPDKDIVVNLYLIDFNTGEEICYNCCLESGDYKWSYAYSSNGFTTSIPFSNSSFKQQSSQKEEKHKNRIRHYVYCLPSALGKDKPIAVLVKAPDGEHSTGLNGDQGEEFVLLRPIYARQYSLDDMDMQAVLQDLHKYNAKEFTVFAQNTYLSFSEKTTDQYGSRYVKFIHY
ncbi:protein of unknown function [Xenorhabdus poinarii G6]|uniref:Uncharacterized protein n=1 Tax=Xenorhabdus poinarii G6 TaxID=1354304 RepID=A0A068QXZ3_9GAMM|nr:hypothetical protein [Xenorhabdus poinarii]CDG19788.1 protein of unknown function [Xenorhabdus poinarii G6]